MKLCKQYYALILSSIRNKLYEDFQEVLILPFIRFMLIFSATGLSLSNAASQPARSSAIALTSSGCIRGSFQATKHSFGQHETLVGTLNYEFVESNLLGDRYNLVGGNYTWTASGTMGSCAYQGGPCSFNISSASGDNGFLNIDKSGNYYGESHFAELTNGNLLVTITCGDTQMQYPPILGEMFTGLMDSTFVITNLMSGTYNMKYSEDYYSTYSWNLYIGSAGEPKLSVEAAGYDHLGNEIVYNNWLPEAALSGVEADLGNTIKFQARLIGQDGTPACATADSFRFELKEVSNEPGVCMNYPKAEVAKSDYDLHFRQELNSPDDVMSSNRLKLQTRGGSEANATVGCFDWGAYGTLKVTAIMPGGKKITGFLSGYPEITDILIPKRSNGSKIADIWKQVNRVPELADDDDSESTPVGDSDPGDGFTLYEEYRGFSVKGEYTNGNPTKKDLFIFSESNDFLPGIQLFKGLTNLEVHTQLYESEFDKKNRLMNFNHSVGPDKPHSVDQHGLWIKPIAPKDAKGYSFTDHLGPPKNVDSVNISPTVYSPTSIEEGSSATFHNQLNSIVAHELGHAVHIAHHGEGDKKRLWVSRGIWNTVTKKFDFEYFENSQDSIQPKRENGQLLSRNIGTLNIWVAMWGGQHSGFEDCIMRYDCAEAYIPGIGAASNIRYVIAGDEKTGMTLCDQKEDSSDGVNYLNRQPRSRYGSAVKGNCKSQICVNDKYH